MENYQIANAIRNKMTKQMLRQTTIGMIDKLWSTLAFIKKPANSAVINFL